MHTIQLYIDDELSPRQLDELRDTLMALPHVQFVGLNTRLPHDLLVEYEQQYLMPMDIVKTLHSRGMHPDVISC